ncbi:50S ribosomal protein L31e [Candidatus Woesearchaeota archaeon]|nr:50S ribosomal protein L31e [Candidatus Woesearchaeota archaeon]
MAVERTYTIPLRREWLKAPKYRRAKKAVNAVKEFLIKHMKSEDVRLGKYLNEEIWKDGMKNPPGKVKVNVLKDDKGVVRAELFGKKIDTGEKKEEKKGIATKMKEKITGKKAEPKKEAVKKEKKEEAKVEKKKTEEKKEEVKKETVPKKEEVKEKKIEKKEEALKVEEKTKEAVKEEKKETPKAEDKK